MLPPWHFCVIGGGGFELFDSFPLVPPTGISRARNKRLEACRDDHNGFGSARYRLAVWLVTQPQRQKDNYKECHRDLLRRPAGAMK